MIKTLFLGRKTVAAKSLDALIASGQFNVVGVVTDSHLSKSVTADVAIANKIPLLTLEEANDRVTDGTLSFDVGFSVLYWRKIKGNLLNHPKYGTINFHPAPLPEFKGVGGYNLAILHNLDKWSVTAHLIDHDIDSGPIIGSCEFEIDHRAETALSLERRSQIALSELFLDVMRKVAAAPDGLQVRPNGPGLYVSRRELEEMKEVDLSDDDIDRKIRAFWFPPYDGAFIQLNGEKFTLVNRAILKSLADPDASSLFTEPATLDPESPTC